MKRRILALLAVALVASGGGCPQAGNENGEPKCIDLKGNEVECPERWDNEPLHGPNWG